MVTGVAGKTTTSALSRPEVWNLGDTISGEETPSAGPEKLTRIGGTGVSPVLQAVRMAPPPWLTGVDAQVKNLCHQYFFINYGWAIGP